MKQKSKTNFRFNNYDAGDAGIVFLLALVLPQFLVLFAMLICSKATGLPITSTEVGVETFVDKFPLAYTLICTLIPQISMIVSFVVVTERKKVNYLKGNQISFKKFNPLVLLVVLAIGVVCLFGFSPFVSWFDNLVAEWGYKSSVANIDLGSAGKLVGAIFYVGLVPAICEELVFRGIIANGLKQNGTRVAVVFGALLFALMHQNLQQFVYQLFLGGVMTYIVLKTGNILYTMLLHFVNNFVVLLNTYLTQNNNVVTDYSSAWSNIWPFLVMILAVAGVVGLLVLMNYILKRKNGCTASQKVKNIDIARVQSIGSGGVQLTDSGKVPTNCSGEVQTNYSSKVQAADNKKDKTSSGKDQLAQDDAQQTGSLQNQAPKNIKAEFVSALKNPFFICGLVAGVLFWIFSVYSAFA